MTRDDFWNIVEKVHRTANGNMDKKCALLDAELRRLPLEEVRSFHAHFDECEDRAYSWDLWAAAYIIGGGCGDDGFSDFRSTLISMGRGIFEQALANPESLADIDYDSETAQFEGYQYVPNTVESDLSGGQPSPRSRPHPAKPSGTPWDEAKVAERYPKLAEKYGYAG
jgi:hypothetical protein